MQVPPSEVNGRKLISWTMSLNTPIFSRNLVIALSLKEGVLLLYLLDFVNFQNLSKAFCYEKWLKRVRGSSINFFKKFLIFNRSSIGKAMDTRVKFKSPIEEKKLKKKREKKKKEEEENSFYYFFSFSHNFIAEAPPPDF